MYARASTGVDKEWSVELRTIAFIAFGLRMCGQWLHGLHYCSSWATSVVTINSIRSARSALSCCDRDSTKYHTSDVKFRNAVHQFNTPSLIYSCILWDELAWET